MVKLNKQIILSDRTSIESKKKAVEHMWEVISPLLFEDSVKYIEALPELQKIARMEEKCVHYFDDTMYREFGFKDAPCAGINHPNFSTL